MAYKEQCFIALSYNKIIFLLRNIFQINTIQHIFLIPHTVHNVPDL